MNPINHGSDNLMKTIHYRLLRGAIIVMGIAYTVIFGYALITLGGDPSSYVFYGWVFLLRGIILMAVGLTIAIKLPRHNEHIFFALFLVQFAFYSWIVLWNVIFIVDVLAWAMAAASFVYAMIVYPGAAAPELYARHFSHSRVPAPIKKIVAFFISAQNFWLIFFPALVVMRLSVVVFGEIAEQLLNIFAIGMGLIYFGISYRFASEKNRSRLAWILWGAVVVVVITLVDVLIHIFTPEVPPFVADVIIALISATICVSVIMGVFFAGFLDTDLVLRSTIVYSALFLFVIFLFSFIEAYILHTISYFLHVQNELASAFLAGFLSLTVAPLHKRLEHVVGKKVTSKNV